MLATQKQAIESYQRVQVHLSDGSIGEKNAYGNDPNPPRDSR